MLSTFGHDIFYGNTVLVVRRGYLEPAMVHRGCPEPSIIHHAAFDRNYHHVKITGCVYNART